MSTAIRRKGERKRTQSSAGKAGGSNVVRRAWANEALALACFAVAIFILVSALSFHFSSRMDVVAHASLRNPMGPVGRFVGTLLSTFLGWGTMVPVAWSAWLGYYLWNRDDSKPLLEIHSKVLLPLGLAGMLVFSCALLSLLWISSAGGASGIFISAPLARLFGVPGASLIIGALLLASLAIATRQSVATISSAVLDVLKVVARFFAMSVPYGCFVVLRVTGRGLASALVYCWHAIFYTEKQDAPLPTPRVRRNIIETGDKHDEKDDEGKVGEDSDEEEQDTEEDEEELGVSGIFDGDPAPVSNPTPAVVQRVVNDSRVGDSELRKVRKRIVENLKESEAFRDYVLPDLNLLTRGEVTPGAENDEELREKSRQIESKLRDFDINGKVTQIHPGPVITLFEFEPAPGVKVGRIASLQDDLAMTLKASSIRIIAPIPKRGTVGIEVPNRVRDIVRLRDLLESPAFIHAESLLSVPIGKDTYGEPVVVDIAQMPHLLMAGTTGTGKSVCINAILLSLLYKSTPAELGLILIDPKILELSTYEDIPHLRVPVVTVPRQAKAVLEWAVNEMNRRYRVMQKFGVRNIDSYNKVVAGEPTDDMLAEEGPSRFKGDVLELKDEEIVEAGIIDKPDPASVTGIADVDLLMAEKLRPLPKIVIVIDELADLMLTVGKDVEQLITRIAQKARAAGIHLIIATQRPSVDVVTGLIKANFPARISFRVATRVDSRTILDVMGADKLLGRGDMLTMIPGQDGLRRMHGAFVSDNEVTKVVNAIKAKAKPNYDERIMALCDKALEEDRPENGEGGIVADDYDDMYDKCVELVVGKGHASTSMLQRAFRLGYNRAARIIDMMEREGVVGPMDGAKPREVLVASEQAQREGTG